MPKNKRPYQLAVGKLISAIQKYWNDEMGENSVSLTEDAISKCHLILNTESIKEVHELLGEKTLRQYLGDIWLKNHPDVMPQLIRLEEIIYATRYE